MTDILHLLQSGQSVQISPEGYSMYPMLIPGRDAVVLEPMDEKTAGDIRRGDVLLFRDTFGRLAVHRVWKVADDGIYLMGDNQTEAEGPIPRERIFARMRCFLRAGRMHSAHHPPYRLYWNLWLWLCPLRRLWHQRSR